MRSHGYLWGFMKIRAKFHEISWIFDWISWNSIEVSWDPIDFRWDFMKFEWSFMRSHGPSMGIHEIRVKFHVTSWIVDKISMEPSGWLLGAPGAPGGAGEVFHLSRRQTLYCLGLSSFLSCRASGGSQQNGTIFHWIHIGNHWKSMKFEWCFMRSHGSLMGFCEIRVKFREISWIFDGNSWTSSGISWDPMGFR